MADRKTEILEATCRVIARSGAHDLRVEDVAKEASVSPALVYYYFDTRAELLSRAFEFADARSTAHTMKHIQTDLSGRERLHAILFHEFDDAPDVRDNWVIWGEMSSTAVFDKDLLATLDTWSRNWVKMVADLIRDGQQDGSIAADANEADAAAERLTAIVDSLGGKIQLGFLDPSRGRTILQEALDMELGADRGVATATATATAAATANGS